MIHPWRTYMGRLYQRGKAKYYIVKEFRKNRASSTWHGNSSIYFFSMQKKLYATVNVGMPENLPFKFIDDKLHFRYKQNGISKVDIVDLKSGLPKMLCTRPGGCEAVVLDNN